MTEIALSSAASLGGGSDVGALWLTTQQVIAARIAHELRNSLNGVAVNLEVVRSRLARVAAQTEAAVSPSTAAAAARAVPLPLSFADTASGEFERLSAAVEALMALVRPARSPADVSHVAAQLGILLGLAARRDGGSLTVEGTDDGAARTSMDAEAVRLVVARAMLAALQDGVASEIRCTVTRAPGEGPRLSMIRTGGGDPIALPDDVARVAGEAGVRTLAAPDTGLILAFPPAPGADD